jgi:hypothetical protein
MEPHKSVLRFNLSLWRARLRRGATARRGRAAALLLIGGPPAKVAARDLLTFCDQGLRL